jgi:hypothetical protein
VRDSKRNKFSPSFVIHPTCCIILIQQNPNMQYIYVYYMLRLISMHGLHVISMLFKSISRSQIELNANVPYCF